MSIFVDHKALKHALKGLKDIHLTGLAGGDILSYDDFLKKWCNFPFPIHVLDDLEDVEVANPNDMDMIIFAGIGNKWVKQPCTLDRHKDVEISSPADGEVVTYEGATALWKNKPPPPAGAITYQTVLGTTDVSTESTVYVDMPDMTLTVAEAGTYLILFSTSCLCGRGTTQYWMYGQLQLLRNADVLARATMPYLQFSLQYLIYYGGSASMMCVSSLSVGDVVKVQWRTGCQTGTPIMYNRPATQQEHRSLTIVRLA